MKILLGLMLLTFCAPTFAQSIEGAWIKEPFPGMKMTGGYMVIKNDSAQDFALTSITGEDCEAYEIHTHSKVDGVMKMRQLQKLEIKAHSAVTLKPKSFHIMMIQLKNKFSVGQKKKMTLHFSNGKSVEVSAPVRKMK